MNRVVRLVLRSPLGRALPGLCEVTYRAPRSGRVVSLPEQCAADEHTAVVLPAGSTGKRWWRAFRSPHPATVRLRGRAHTASGRLVRAGDAGRPEAERLYRAAHPRITVAAEDPLVVLDLDPAREGPRR